MRFKGFVYLLVVFVSLFLLRSTESLEAPEGLENNDAFGIRESRLLQPEESRDLEATEPLSTSVHKPRNSKQVENDFGLDLEPFGRDTDSEYDQSQPAAAPKSSLDIVAYAPASEDDGVKFDTDAQVTPLVKTSAKRYAEEPTKTRSKTEEPSEEEIQNEVGIPSEDGIQFEGNNTHTNRSLNDTREEVQSVKKTVTRVSVPEPTEEETAVEESNLNEAGVQENEIDDEEGQVTGFQEAPRLSHRTSSWEGFGDPSKKLTLVVVCSNVGGGTLEVKIVTPTWIRAEPESVRIAGGEERNVTLTVLDPKGLKGASERIQIQSNGGDEFFEITKAALGRSDWYDGIPSSGGNSGLLAIGAAIVGLAGLGFCLYRRRKQRHGASSFKYKELEMQGDLSSALGQLPVNNTGMNVSYSSGYGSGRRAQAEDDSTQGWDDNWDDWDEEDQRSRRKDMY